MTLSRRHLLLAGLAGTATALTGCGTGDKRAVPADAPVGIRAGYQANFNGASTYALAAERGLWKKHRLDADVNPFTNGPIQVQALGAGDLDFAYLGPGALWLPASGQSKIAAVNSVGLSDRVIAQPGIDGVGGLKGKKVAVPQGTSGDMLLRLALEAEGMSVDDVELVVMDPTTVVTAFSSGKVDAAGIWYPLVDTIRGKVPKLQELAKNEDFGPEVTFPSVFVARNEIAEGETETVERFVAVVREANDYRAANMKEAIAVTARFLKVEEKSLAAEAETTKWPTTEDLDAWTEDGSVANWLTALNELFTEFGQLKGKADPSAYYLGDTFTSAGKA